MRILKAKFYFLYLITLGCFISACSDEKKTYYEIADEKVVYHFVKRKASNLFTASYHKREVKDADINSFVTQTYRYAKDNQHVFYEGRNLGKRDVNSFSVLSVAFTVDKFGAYYRNQIIEGSDGQSFKVLNPFYNKDNTSIYTYNGSHVSASKTIDYATFKIVKEEYAIDKNAVFYKGNILEGLNNQQFKILENNYCIDPENVFYEDLKVMANAKYFEVIEYGYAKDDKNIFFEDINLNADYNSFKIYRPKKNEQRHYLAEDKFFYYSGITATKK